MKPRDVLDMAFTEACSRFPDNPAKHRQFMDAIEWAEAEYRITGPRSAYVPCERCGKDYGMDAVVESSLWNEVISPTGDGNGFLCLWCMDDIAASRGASGEVRVYFMGKALRSALYPGDGNGE